MQPPRITTIAIFGTLAALAQIAQQSASDLASQPATQEPPAFEAASVKPTDPSRGGSTFNFAPGQLQISGGTLRRILEMAYDLRTFQILGGPAWLDADRFDISATNDAALKNLNQQERAPQMRLRLQTLLTDRFQLKVHRETREMTEYALVAAKSGSKLKQSVGEGNGISTNCGVMTGTRTTMSNLAVVLSRQLGRPVLDRTDLSERYDFEIRFTPETGCGSRPPDADASKSDSLPDSPSIFAAIQEQVGLKLESFKGPVEVIIIDHAAKPDAN